MGDRKPRIYVDKSNHLLFKELSEGKSRPFDTMRDAFLAAVCKGYKNKTRVPLKDPKDILIWDSLGREGEILLIALALVEKNDPVVLKDKKEIAKIAEEYANGGIKDLHNKLINQAGGATINLIDLILKQKK
jgi:dnd system-associated protein 4